MEDVLEVEIRDCPDVRKLLALEVADFPCTYTCEETGRTWTGRGTLRDDRRTVDFVTDDGERLIIDLGRQQPSSV